MAKQETFRRWYKPQPLQAALPALTKELLRQRGIDDPTLLMQWRTIVGEALASICTLEKITFVGYNRNTGTVFIRCKPQDALDVLHQQTHLLNKINTFFGYKAISYVKISQYSS